MCGSALDGEDVVQEVIAQALERLDSLDDSARLEPWLFRIAHHQCVDFLRRERRWREDVVSYDDAHDVAIPADEPPVDDVQVIDALAALMDELPPKERAALLLKDVLGYPLTDVADIIDSTAGGVKAALHRARTKLDERRRAAVERPPVAPRALEQRSLYDAYVECFNRRDWDALKRLVRADARLELACSATGTMGDLGLRYTGNYTALAWPWRLSVGYVDGELVVVHWREADGAWRPLSAVRLWCENGEVIRIRDYIHVSYLLDHARVEHVSVGN